jgi:hypothetical protein
LQALPAAVLWLFNCGLLLRDAMYAATLRKNNSGVYTSHGATRIILAQELNDSGIVLVVEGWYQYRAIQHVMVDVAIVYPVAVIA